jgi:O-antigen ligase
MDSILLWLSSLLLLGLSRLPWLLLNRILQLRLNMLLLLWHNKLLLLAQGTAGCQLPNGEMTSSALTIGTMNVNHL